MADQNITLSGISSTLAFGTLLVQGGEQDIILKGIPSSERHGFLTIVQAGYQPLRYYRAGLCRNHLMLASLSISERLGGGSTSSFTEQWPFVAGGDPPDRPICGTEILFTEGGRKEFLGNIDTFDEVIANDSMSKPHYWWKISCRDLSARLDARLVTRDYEAGSARNIMQDIADSFLTGENLTTNGITTTAVIPAPISFKGESVRSAFQKICDQTGDVFGIDYNRDIYCYAPGNGPTMAMAFTDTSDNVRAQMMTVTRSNTGKANTVATRTGINLG